MIIADQHTHSTFSTDGISTLEEMVKGAIEKGIEILCVTEHMDFDNHYYLLPSFCEEFPGLSQAQCQTLFMCDTDAYCDASFSLKDKYRSQIDLRFGIELGLRPDLDFSYSDYVKKYPFDFVIGSTHEVEGIDPYYKEFLKGRDAVSAYRVYFQNEILNAKACIDSFDVFGHIDYALRYHVPEGYVFNYSDFSDEIDTLLKILIDAGKGIELNTGGFKYFKTEPNPRIPIIRRYRELGGEIITVGSDAHSSTAIAGNFGKAADILKECGFKYYSVFKNRTPKSYLL